MSDRVLIRKLPSGVPGLDEVLGGGFPEFSFNLIAGGPGCGKTTLAHQIMFANASPERKAIYFTIIGEPPIKMLRYQQQYAFFDAGKVGDGSIRFIHLGQQALDGGMAKVLEPSLHEVEKTSPGIVVVDSFRSMVRRTLDAGPRGEEELQGFMQRLALHLTSCEATTFLVGEYGDGEHDNAVFTVADGIIWLYQAVDRNSVVRKLQVMKMRGQGQIPGLHTVRITDGGFSVFPRLLKPAENDRRASSEASPVDRRRRPRRDDGRRHPRGYSVLVAGPSGSGKTVLSNQFIIEGASRGEPGIVADLREAAQRLSTDDAARGEEFEQAGSREEARGHLSAPARSLDRRDAARDPEGREAHRREAGCHRLAVRPRARAGADVPRGLSRIAVPDGGRADRARRHGHGDRGARGLVYRAFASARRASRF